MGWFSAPVTSQSLVVDQVKLEQKKTCAGLVGVEWIVRRVTWHFFLHSCRWYFHCWC